MKISVAFCIYNDFDFLAEAFDKIYELADEIVILDGPYRYCVPILQEFELLYDERDSPLKGYQQKEKVVYSYSTFENEEAKRIELYNSCSGDIVILVDSDEVIVDIDRQSLYDFWGSDRSVGCFSIRNLVRRDVALGPRVKKFVVFKSAKIGATEHLNYTWLVGVKQDKPDPAKMFGTPIGEIAHLTLMRSSYFNTVKYCFYTRLYHYTNDEHHLLDTVFGRKFEELNKLGIGKERMRGIFRRSMPALLNFPGEDALKRVLVRNLSQNVGVDLSAEVFRSSTHIDLLSNVFAYQYVEIPLHLKEGDPVDFSFSLEDGAGKPVTVQILQHNHRETTQSQLDLVLGVDGYAHGTFFLSDDAANLFGVLIGARLNSAVNDVLTLTHFCLKRRFALYGNCQTESVRDVLRLNADFNRKYVIEQTPGRLVHMMNATDIADFKKILHRVDCLLCQPVSANYNGSTDFSTERLLSDLRPDVKVYVMPNLFFTGYAPDQYCVSYKKNFLREPMPIHDVNLIYTYLRCGGDRNASLASYIGNLTDPEYYSARELQGILEKNISELRTREDAAEQAILRSGAIFFSYADYLERFSKHRMLHYSDAHPTEVVFRDLGATLLTDLGCEIGEAASLYESCERGCFPLYESVRAEYAIPDTSPIYLNNRPVDRDSFLSAYLDEYGKIDVDELYRYIASSCVRVIVTNHKTGTMLMLRIFREYCAKFRLKLLELNSYLRANGDRIDPHADFQSYDFIFVTHCQHFELLVDAVPKLRYRAIHLIRDPREIIMSGVRYHQTTDEAWCNKKLFVKAAHESGFSSSAFRRIASYAANPEQETGDLTYREIMQGLDQRGRIAFEIMNHSTAFGTINAVAHALKRFAKDGNVRTIRLEDVFSQESADEVFSFLDLRREFFDEYREKTQDKKWLGNHVTKHDGSLSYLEHFDESLHALYNEHLGFASSAFGNFYPTIIEEGEGRPDPEPDAGIGDGIFVDFGSHHVRRLPPMNWEKVTADLESGQLAEACAYLEGYYLTEGYSIGVVGKLGSVYKALDRSEDGMKAFSTIMEQEKHPPVWVYIELAQLLRTVGRSRDALEVLKSGLARNPADPSLKAMIA